jgi:hypothetical protein
MDSLSVGCDAHKHYSQLEIQSANGKVVQRARVDHSSGAIRSFFSSLPRGTPVALESVGNWYLEFPRSRGQFPMPLEQRWHPFRRAVQIPTPLGKCPYGPPRASFLATSSSPRESCHFLT